MGEGVAVGGFAAEWVAAGVSAVGGVGDWLV